MRGVKKKQPNKAPLSVGIIMDGNGRWATRRALSRSEGHIAGARVIEGVLETLFNEGVRCVTLYAFSTENKKRPKEEVDALMELMYNYLDGYLIDKLREGGNLSVRFIGDLDWLPDKLSEKCALAQKISENRPCVCNIALNYGGRDEIVRAANLAFMKKGASLTEKDISEHLYTADCPDPDLIIRTGGDLRTSNFLIWQSAYSELYFTRTLWPDFGPKQVKKALKSYYKRSRRFGALDSQKGERENR